MYGGFLWYLVHVGVSENGGTPKSSILNHPFWGTPIFGITHVGKCTIHGSYGILTELTGT